MLKNARSITQGTVSRWAERWKNFFNHNVLFDHGNKISSLFQARTTPHCYVIDKKGVIRYAGGLDDDKGNKDPQKATRYVRDAIDAILANKEIEVQSSRPYG